MFKTMVLTTLLLILEDSVFILAFRKRRYLTLSFVDDSLLSSAFRTFLFILIPYLLDSLLIHVGVIVQIILCLLLAAAFTVFDRSKNKNGRWVYVPALALNAIVSMLLLSSVEFEKTTVNLLVYGAVLAVFSALAVLIYGGAKHKLTQYKRPLWSNIVCFAVTVLLLALSYAGLSL